MGNSVSTTAHIEDIDLGDDISDEQLNAILDSGDADAIEALMRGEVPEIKPVPEITAAQESKHGEVIDGAASGADEAKQADTTDADGDDVDPTKAPVLSKDGKRTIPYEVLEAARKSAQAAKEEVNSLREKVAEYEGKNQLVNKFLAAKGIDPASITDAQAESLTEDEIKQLEELDPLLGKAVRLMNERLNMPVPTPEPVQTGNPVMDAIARNSDLSSWRQQDPDRWDFAVTVDEKLKADPKFSSLSLEERFAEVARRTRVAFGDDIPATHKQQSSTAEVAAKKIAEVSAASVPRSLSNIGVTPSSERSLLEQLADLPPDEIEARMASMTPAQIQELLGGIQ